MKSYAPPKLRQVVTEAIFRRRRLVLLTVMTVMVLTALAIALMHKKYSAQAKLMVQNVRSNAPLNTSPTERLVSQQDVSVTEVNSEVDLLQSQAVARRALEQGPSATSPGRPDSRRQAAAIATLQHQLTVEPVHQTSLINVSLLANSPEQAEQQLNNVLNAFFEERAGTGRAGSAAEFFTRQMNEKSSQLDADTRALTDFEIAHNLADLDDQKKLQVQRIAGLEDQLNAADTLLARSRSQSATNRRQLSVTPPRSVATERTITNQYSQEHLATELIDLQNHRAELAKRYPPTDRQIVETDEKIAAMQRGIAASRRDPATELATEVNPVWQSLTASVASSAADVSGLDAQRAELARQRQQARARLGELQEATATYAELKRRLAQTQSDYALYVQKRDESRVAEALDKEKMFDVALVQPPMASYAPVRPRPVLYLATAFIFSLLLGIGLALYADTSAEQVYTPSQLDALTGMRTLATLADENEASDGAQRNRTELRRVLVAVTERPDGAAAQSPDDPVPAGVAVAFTSALNGEGVSHVVRGLASEAGRQAETRVAVLSAAAMAARFEHQCDVSFALHYDDVRQYWTLAEPADGSVQPTTEPLGTHRNVDFSDLQVDRVLQGGSVGRFSARLRPLLAEARDHFDYILVDCPSLQTSTLATELDTCVDGYVAVVGAGMGRKSNIENMTDTLGDRRAPLLGFVFNRRTYAVPAWLHRLVWSRA